MMKKMACVALIVSSVASAHIKMTTPASWQVTGPLGDPQKLAPCGDPGTATNAVTTVEAGSQLTVQWTETIGHPGHFRISIAENRSLLIDPVATVTANDCKSAVIQNPVVSPTLLDGLYPHATGAMGHVYTQTITVPSTPCNNCTLQLLQFMSSHPPDCFYHQCANLKIVARDAGVGVPDAGAKDSGVADAGPRDSGVVGTQDSGVLFDAGSSYDAGTGVDDAGATLDSGTEAQDAGMNADSGTAPIDNNPFVDPFRRDAGTGTNNPGGQGCSCNSSFDFAVLGLVAAFVVLRRKSV
jgi:hypothetical protein